MHECVCGHGRFGSLSTEYPVQWSKLPKEAQREDAWRFVAPELGGAGKGVGGTDAGSGAAPVSREGASVTMTRGGGDGEADEFEYECDITDAKIDVEREGRYHYPRCGRA